MGGTATRHDSNRSICGDRVGGDRKGSRRGAPSHLRHLRCCGVATRQRDHRAARRGGYNVTVPVEEVAPIAEFGLTVIELSVATVMVKIPDFATLSAGLHKSGDNHEAKL